MESLSVLDSLLILAARHGDIETLSTCLRISGKPVRPSVVDQCISDAFICGQAGVLASILQ